MDKLDPQAALDAVARYDIGRGAREFVESARSSIPGARDAAISELLGKAYASGALGVILSAQLAARGYAGKKMSEIGVDAVKRAVAETLAGLHSDDSQLKVEIDGDMLTVTGSVTDIAGFRKLIG